MLFSANSFHLKLTECAALCGASFPPKRFIVAYSGGLDSTVLLHVLAQLRQRITDFELLAVHVHHGLLEQADKWVLHCESISQRLGVRFHAVRVDAKARQGESQEARARDARYQALSELMLPGDVLLTAHQQDDQAETVLLQLLRGAGVRGLSAMPTASTFGEGYHWRPLLSFTREQLADYGENHQLIWVDDPSNVDIDYDRNFIRHEISPKLRARWSSFSKTLARSASACADAALILEDVASADLANCHGSQHSSLSIKKLLELSIARRRNVLMVWIQRQRLPLPSFSHLQHVEQDVLSAKTDAMPLVAWPGCEIRRYRDDLFAGVPLGAFNSKAVYEWNLEQSVVIPNWGGLEAKLQVGEGLDPDAVRGRPITVRFRQGGETCRPFKRGQTHELKKLFQELSIPPWLRDRIPLIYAGDDIACVPGYFGCEPFWRVGGRVWHIVFDRTTGA